MEAEYYLPHLAHATMEPLVATGNLKTVQWTIWAPTQNPRRCRKPSGSAGHPQGKCNLPTVTMLGGGFGRKSKPDYVAEAAVLSKKVGKPVKVVWSAKTT